MIKHDHRQAGSVHSIIIVVLVVALLGVLGFIFWQNFMKEDSVSTEPSKSTDVPKDDKSNAETVVYRNETIGIEFTYPKDWIKLECDNTYIENPQRQVYFGTTNEGLAIVDGKSTQLCGGGSDFPPQIFFSIAENNDEYAQYGHISPFTNIRIDDKDARRSIALAGPNTIMSGLESTRYFIDINDSQHITFGYNRYPNISGGLRDNSEFSRQKFMDVIEKSLRFL